ncbi:hypothetical protein NA57DRAFT_54907 [Rhizodiscina lignyota]|uniref:NACHT domain-containing protein n=1 Tax=Rhizodiscina lignyota TaxID=1504668 RepID=A0A9P4IIY0_9PEZI|nr:hypothetical protein NA57DRAFT_54907 [Rhizodiscina lignyota]
MADPLSIASGVAGLLSLGLQTTDTLVKFYTSYKGRDDNIARTTQRLETLQGAFDALQTTLQQRKFQPDEEMLIGRIESSIQLCGELIQELQEECRKLTGPSSNSFKEAVKFAGRRAAYPFRESTLKKLEEAAGEMRNHLSLALDILQLQDHKTAQDELTEMKSLVELMRATQMSSTIQDWFKAPDALIEHNDASAKRHPGTGMWFVKDPIFRSWISQANSFLWLYGFAGCGKSVLCSTAIQHAFRQRRRDASIGVAFFYFKFNDESKQTQSAMLRALLWQLASQLSDGHSRIQRLHESYKTGSPPAAVLSEQLRECIRPFHQVYVLIDALDESPRGSRRDNILSTIRTMRDWSMPGLHLLVTSRDELDIRESVDAAPDEEVAMKNDGIDQDISNFIAEKLSTDLKLRTKWQAHRDRIQEALAKGAQGVFRWVDCQFEALRRCPRSKHHLEQCLRSLPRSLDETYERMLLSIDEESYEEARRILMLLCFSSRPLKVSEVLHGIAVDLGEQACLNRDRLLEGTDDLCEICSGLIDFGFEAKEGVDSNTDSTSLEVTVRIAHFSVQEYLESARIRQHNARFFAMTSISAHQEIATICCVYLLEPELSKGQLTPEKLVELPLAHFAAQFWYHHYQKAKNTTKQLHELIIEIFLQHNSFVKWVRLHDLADRPWVTEVRFERTSDDIAPALYYASFLGLDWIIHEILRAGIATGRKGEDIVNAQGGYYGNALQAASSLRALRRNMKIASR